jgi:hypothetical protein
MIDLNVILWTLLLAPPILFFFTYWVIVPFIELCRSLLPSPKPKQRVLTEWIDDKYPYNKRWVSPDEDSEFSEASGYESSAVMDEEDGE